MLINNYPFEFTPFWPAFVTLFVFIFLVDFVLRALSLWRAARANQSIWFIALLIFNTIGILPLIYLLFFSKEPLVERERAREPSITSVKPVSRVKKNSKE